MTLTFEQARFSVDRDWRHFLSLLTPLTEEDWAGPTRLTGWTVRDLAAHAVWGVSMEADALRRWRTGAEGRADGRDLGPTASGEPVVNELDAAVRALASELELAHQGPVDAPAPLPYGDVPVPLFLEILVMEAGIHASDLAASLGFDDSLAEDVVASTAVFLRTFVPVLASGAAETPPPGTAIALRGTSVRLDLRFTGERWEAIDTAHAPVATISGDDGTVLLFALGRVPVGDPYLSIAGDAAAAQSFKRWVPGP